jgi:glycosyltransferase involved in cell wall biosynthesis
MRIVHVITRLIIGGAQENTLLSCQAQHQRGHDVTLITGPPIGPEGSLLERAQAAGYRVVVMNELRRAIHPAMDWRAYRALVDQFRQMRPDVVHTHSSKAGIIGRWAAERARVRFIVHTIHGLAFTASTHRIVNHIYKWLERETAPRTDRIVCVADAMRDQSLAAGIGWPSQYVTIYSGMETAPFVSPAVPRDEMRRKLGIKDPQIIVGTIARLFHLKGHDDLLAIAPHLCAIHPQLRFLWVGDGLLRQQFERQITQMGLADRFILAGLVPPEDVPPLVGAMDIVAHPSRREGLARALPQGALAAKPTITYDIDGAKEAVMDGQTGYVLPPFDRAALSAAIDRLARDADLRNRFGHAGRQFALARFDARVMADALESLYRTGVGESEKP